MKMAALLCTLREVRMKPSAMLAILLIADEDDRAEALCAHFDDAFFVASSCALSAAKRGK